MPSGAVAALGCKAVVVEPPPGVLLSAGHPRTRDLLAAAGLRVVELQTRQVGLLDAGVSCLSLRWSTTER